MNISKTIRLLFIVSLISIEGTFIQAKQKAGAKKVQPRKAQKKAKKAPKKKLSKKKPPKKAKKAPKKKPKRKALKKPKKAPKKKPAAAKPSSHKATPSLGAPAGRPKKARAPQRLKKQPPRKVQPAAAKPSSHKATPSLGAPAGRPTPAPAPTPVPPPPVPAPVPVHVPPLPKPSASMQKKHVKMPVIHDLDQELERYTANITAESFDRTLDQFGQVMIQELNQPAKWLGTKPVPAFFDLSPRTFAKIEYPVDLYPHYRFSPFAQKVIIPSGMSLYIFGDIHGHDDSLRSAFALLMRKGVVNHDLKVLRNDVGFIFLGDYVDRGNNSIGVLNMQMQFKISNPNTLIIYLRGNHEDILINARYGLADEMKQKWQKVQGELLWEKTNRMFELLPCVSYLVSQNKPHDVIQFSHGVMDLGYDPRQLLHAPAPIEFQFLGTLNRKTMYDQLIQKYPDIKQDMKQVLRQITNVTLTSPTEPSNLGFMWNDIQVDKHTPTEYQHGRGWGWSHNLITSFLNYLSTNDMRLRSIIRGHQHNDSWGNMFERLKKSHGMVSLWPPEKNNVYTLLSAYPSPDNTSIKSFAKLTTAPRYEQWMLEHMILE